AEARLDVADPVADVGQLVPAGARHQVEPNTQVEFASPPEPEQGAVRLRRDPETTRVEGPGHAPRSEVGDDGAGRGGFLVGGRTLEQRRHLGEGNVSGDPAGGIAGAVRPFARRTPGGQQTLHSGPVENRFIVRQLDVDGTNTRGQVQLITGGPTCFAESTRMVAAQDAEPGAGE